jgi:hypothetical protein
VSTKLFPGVSYMMVENAKADKSKAVRGSRRRRRLWRRRRCSVRRSTIASPKSQCGKTPCPMAGLKLCTICGDIKKTTCRKTACVAALQPLRLTMREAPALDAAATEAPALEAAATAPTTAPALAPAAPEVIMEADDTFLPLAQRRPQRGATV